MKVVWCCAMGMHQILPARRRLEAGASCVSPVESPGQGRRSSAPGAGVLMAWGSCSGCFGAGKGCCWGSCPRLSPQDSELARRREGRVWRALCNVGATSLTPVGVRVFISCIKVRVLSLISNQGTSCFRRRVALPCIQAEFGTEKSLGCLSCFPNTTWEFF